MLGNKKSIFSQERGENISVFSGITALNADSCALEGSSMTSSAKEKQGKKNRENANN